jgi:hypothetical protein
MLVGMRVWVSYANRRPEGKGRNDYLRARGRGCAGCEYVSFGYLSMYESTRIREGRMHYSVHYRHAHSRRALPACLSQHTSRCGSDPIHPTALDEPR